MKQHIFLHVPKTAGSSLRTLIQQNYQGDETIAFSGALNAVDWYRSRPVAFKRKHRLLHGHVHYGIHEGLTRYLYFTFLRDPVARHFSDYDFLRRYSDHPMHASIASGEISLVDWASIWRQQPMFQNIATQYVSGEQNGGDRLALEKAKLHIRREFAFVGLSERFDESVLILARRLGWRSVFYLTKNATSERTRPTPEMARLAAEGLERDIELYQFAAKIFDDSPELQDPAFGAALSEFRATREWLEGYVKNNAGEFYEVGFDLPPVDDIVRRHRDTPALDRYLSQAPTSGDSQVAWFGTGPSSRHHEPMTPETIASEFEAIVREDGPWTTASFELAPGVWTSQASPWNRLRARYALDNACMMLGKAPKDLRVLDLGCLEGQIAISLAQMGCTVVGLEYRRASLRKADFAARALNVANVSWVQADMLRLDELDLGTFDVVLAFGVLYHVDASDLRPFITSIDGVCTGLAIFDTHVSLEALETYTDPSGLRLVGRSIVEHSPGSGNKESKAWAAAENDYAFWMTERSLANLLVSGGLGPVNRSLVPIPEWKWQDRGYWIAYSSSFRTERLSGAGEPAMTHVLTDPDHRPVECDLIRHPNQRRVRNPATRPFQTSAA